MHGEVDLENARQAFLDRLSALSRTQDILTSSHGEGAYLGTLINSALEHHIDVQDRFIVAGPRVYLAGRAVTAFAMAIHELSTNAAKYGALSRPSGTIDVKWWIEGGPIEQERITLRWTESGGPEVMQPKRRGFGTHLIEGGIAMELNGSAKLLYEPGGLVCVIEAPLSSVISSGASDGQALT